MAEIIPFKGWRYNKYLAENIESLISPLFDVVSSIELAELYKKPYNSIHLSVPNGNDPTIDAATLLEKWKEEKVLLLDNKPSIYVYYQYFSIPEQEKIYCRKGFICNIRIYDWDEKVILRHENTIPASVNDRIELLEKTELNVSPTHGLYSDPSFLLEKYMDKSMENVLFDTNDNQGVRDVISVIEDPVIINSFVMLLKDKQIILADGHHRYESSLSLKKKYFSKKESYNYHLMYLTNLESDDIVIHPTHRLLKKLENFDEHHFIQDLEKYFHIQLFDHNINRLIKSFKGLKGMFGIILPSYYLLIKLKPGLEAIISWHFPDLIKELDLTILHYFIIEKIIGIPGKEQRKSSQITFERNLDNCKNKVENGEANVALLVNSVSMEEIKKVCYSGYTLPQKSTYFYPKIITGFVFSSIKENEFTPYNFGV